MQKGWFGIALAALMLAACTSDQQQNYSAPPLPAYNGPIVEIPGIEPTYQAPITTANQDYSVNGITYKIDRDIANFSQIGLAALYGRDAQGNQTTSGEAFDPDAFTAAHPTLPIPAYVRVTNLANNRQVVVRINDRGPFIPGRIIDLSPAAAESLNTSNNSRVRIDIINVARDGTLSGPGTIGTKVAKLSYNLPPRPELSATQYNDAAPEGVTQRLGSAIPPVVTQDDTPSMKTSAATSSAVTGSVSHTVSEQASTTEPTTHSGKRTSHISTTEGTWRLQVAAVNNASRAQSLQQSLSKKYGVPGNVETVNSNVYRVQLGAYSSRSQATKLQQRLATDNIQGFVTHSNQ